MLDLCITGAPKCGTSSLFRWLTAHPQISGPENGKELFFFMDPGHPLTKEPNAHTASPDAYDSLFPDILSTCRLEATTHYLYQDTAREHLANMESQPLIVVVLRDPVQRVWSSFQYTRNNLARMDPSLSFSQYVDWVLQGDGDRVADYVDHAGSAYVLARDIEYSAYVKHLRPWREAVGDERLAIVTFDALTETPQDTCRRLAGQLDVDEDFYDGFDFRSRNATHRPVLRPLQSMVCTVNRHVPDGPLVRMAKRAYKRFATRPTSADRSDENERALERLRVYYQPYNEQLADQFDLSVTEWM